MQVFSISRGLKFDPDVIETFCFCLSCTTLYIDRRANGKAVTVCIHLGRLKTTAWQRMG
jgi:hypothetical protein